MKNLLTPGIVLVLGEILLCQIAIYHMDNIITKISVNDIIYDVGGIDTSDATATQNDIKQGKTAYVNGNKIEGTLSELNVTEITPSNVPKIIHGPGYLDIGGTILIHGDENLISTNIKEGVNIFGVNGSLSSITSYSSENKSTSSLGIRESYTVSSNGTYLVALISQANGLNYFSNRTVYVGKNKSSYKGQTALNYQYAAAVFDCVVGDTLDFNYSNGQEGRNGLIYSFYVSKLS